MAISLGIYPIFRQTHMFVPRFSKSPNGWKKTVESSPIYRSIGYEVDSWCLFWEKCEEKKSSWMSVLVEIFGENLQNQHFWESGFLVGKPTHLSPYPEGQSQCLPSQEAPTCRCRCRCEPPTTNLACPLTRWGSHRLAHPPDMAPHQCAGTFLGWQFLRWARRQQFEGAHEPQLCIKKLLVLAFSVCWWHPYYWIVKPFFVESSCLMCLSMFKPSFIMVKPPCLILQSPLLILKLPCVMIKSPCSFLWNYIKHH